METNKKIIRVGSRKSELALIQTNHVIDCLKKTHPDVEFTIVTMTTLGDRILNVSLPKIGEKSLFTKDLEDALHNNTVDFVVHSLKDLPTSLPEGLGVGAVFEREDPRDALVLREDLKELTLATLPPGSVIGTSSLRRTAQLHGTHPHLAVADVRGNLNTRLRKLDTNTDQEYAALLLAKSGLARMGWEHRISKVLPCSEMMYATGQGALAVECRSSASGLLEMLARHNHPDTYCRVLAERSFLKTLGGGCSAPVGVSTTLKPLNDSFKLTISGAVWSLDGATKVDHRLEHVFAAIRKTSKHRLSPDEEKDNKKFKVPDQQSEPPQIAEYNRRISAKTGFSNCVDTRTEEEIQKLRHPEAMQNEPPQIAEYNRRISAKTGFSNCVDTRTEEEIQKLRHPEAIQSEPPQIAEYNRRISAKTGFSNCVDTRTEEEILKLRHSEAKIFCGLLENTNIPIDVIIKCEEIGKELADILIGKGALEVMRVTQDLIRNSIVNKS